MKAEELISLLLDDDKIKNSRLFGEKIYRDEPILQPASKLVKAPVPDRIIQMKQLSYTSEAMWKTAEWLFCTQGKFMEDFDDSFDFDDVRPLSCPAYKDLTGEELRGFFTWRGKLRRGEEVPFRETYVLLAAFEAINLIGADSPEKAFENLLELYRRFSESRAGGRLSEMLNDMLPYYGLPKELCENLPASDTDRALITLIHCGEADDEALFSALSRFSEHRLESSLAFKKHPDEYRGAVCAAARALSEYCKSTGTPLHVKLFGLMLSRWHMPFRNAVFFRRDPVHADTEYEINEARKYVCEKGTWQLQSYLCTRSKKLGAMMRTADSLIRRQLGIKNELKKGDVSKEEEKVISEAVNGYFAEKKKAAMPKIEIDLSKLGEIRRIADITRDRLIVDEEEKEFAAQEAEPLPPAEEIAPQEQPAAADENAQVLPVSEGELAFLKALLYGGDIKAAAAQAGSMPSLLADSINEKLFDIFSDTVVEFEGDTPVIIEDYLEELKGKIPE